MIKHPLKTKSSHDHQKGKTHSTMSVFQFFKKAKETIEQRSHNALTKIQGKLVEDPSVYVLPPEIRKKITSSKKSPSRDDKSLDKLKHTEVASSKPHLGQKESRKLSELMKKKHDLMARLRKIDQQLHNPSMMPVTMQSNSNHSFIHSEQDRYINPKITESRINNKQQHAYNVSQHEKTVEMLTRLNNQKMRRQQKIVNDMKKKQEKEIKKLEEIEKNKSKVTLSRQNKNMKLLQALNKKQAQKLMQSESADSSPKQYHSFQKQKVQENQFDQLDDIPIGNAEERIPTEEISSSFPQVQQ